MIEPCVIRETAYGWQRSTLIDESFAAREIELSGPIGTDIAMSVIRQLRWLSGQSAGTPITLMINSPGGEVAAGLAIYDTMQALACPINTVCVREASSMAALIFAAGKHRTILPSATVMIHDPLLSGMGGSALSVEETAKRLMQTRKRVAEILAKHTGHNVDEVLERTAKDTYFSVVEAVQWGLADEILTAWGGIANAG